MNIDVTILSNEELNSLEKAICEEREERRRLEAKTAAQTKFFDLIFETWWADIRFTNQEISALRGALEELKE